MNDVRLALIGFGNVAQGLTQILRDHGDQIARKFGLHFLIVSIADPVKGSAFDENGLDPDVLLKTVAATGSLKDMNGPDWDALEMIQNSPADTVVEMSFTNLQTAEPATTYIAESLRRKKNVVTTNKGPIALHYEMLHQIALANDVSIGVEGTVMSGTPVLRVGGTLLALSGIARIQGILNGTTNYILSQMEKGRSYANALAEAQSMGYAEADPTGDVEGYDTAAKVAILSRLVLGNPVDYSRVERKGITSLDPVDIGQARAEGKHWKLVGTLDCSDGKVTATVRPECLPDSHPLAHIDGVTNAIVFTTNILGDVSIVGPGAGRMQTGYGILQDLVIIHR